MELVELSDQVKSDPLAMAIHSIIKVMNIDFPAQFNKAFVDNEALKLVKRRLYTRLRGFDVSFILDAYENLVDKSPKFMPGPNELVFEVKGISVQHGKDIAKLEEAKRVSALPAPTHKCNPVAMLATAKVGSDNDGETGRLARLSKAHDDHAALMKASAGNTERRYADADHQCAFFGCHCTGTISGGSNFYCATHYHASV